MHLQKFGETKNTSRLVHLKKFGLGLLCVIRVITSSFVFAYLTKLLFPGSL